MTSVEKKLKESEERFKALFKGGPVPAYAWQKVGDSFKLIDYNNAANIITQGNVQRFLGFKASEMYRERLDILEDFNNCFDKKTTVIREIKYFFSSLKEEKDLLVKYVFLPADLVLVHTEDITDRKTAEKKLKESEEIYRSLTEGLSQTGIGIDIVDSNYKIIYQNQFLKEQFGEHQNKKCFEFYLGKQKYCEDCPMMKAIQNKKVEKAIITAPNNRSYEIISAPLHNPKGTIERAAEVVIDITERKIIEKKIIDLAKFPSENPNPVMRVNIDKVIYINKAGQNLFNLIKGDPIPKVFQEIIIEIFNENTIKNIEVEIEDKIYSFSITPIQEEGYTNIYGRDVTERKKSEVALKIEKEFTEDILNSSLDTIFVFEPETGKAIRWNKAFKEVTGYSDEEISSMRAPDSYYSEEDLRKGAEASKKVIQKGKATIEMSLITKEGHSIPFEYSGTTIKGSEGELLIVSLGRDITERKAAEQKLKESEMKYREAFNRANFYKDLFTHDMNNILQIINSSAELIDFQLGDSEQSKYIGNMANIIKNQVERGSKFISNVRTLSELEEEEVTTNQIEISTFLKSSIDFVKRAYSERQISILAGKIDEIYFTNGNELLHEVFDNILINSIKYNKNANIEILIKISKQTIDEKDFIKIEFIDNGIGVADDRKEVIFQEQNRELKGSKGMGLGLSLVSKILNIFNGKIWVEDRVKGDYTKGSNFVILLPELNQLD